MPQKGCEAAGESVGPRRPQDPLSSGTWMGGVAERKLGVLGPRSFPLQLTRPCFVVILHLVAIFLLVTIFAKQWAKEMTK